MNTFYPHKNLGDVCENLDKKRVPITKGKRIAGLIPYYGASGIVDYVEGYLFDEDLLLVSEDGANLLARTYPIAFSIQGKTWVNNHAHVLRFNNETHQKFIEYYLNSIKLNDYISGMAQPKLNQKSLSGIQVPNPLPDEQKQIVAILDQAFAAIDQAQANIQQNIQNVQDLFQSKLNQIFSQQGEGWDERKLEDICLKITDGAHHSPKTLYPEKESGLFPYITSKNIRNNYMDFSKLQYVDKSFHSINYSRCSPELGDVLLTKDGANTGNVTLNTLDEPFSLLSSVCLIKTNEELLPKYLKYYIQSPKGFNSITGKMTGTAIKRIILRDIKSAQIPLTTLKKQEELVAQMDSLYETKLSIENKYSEKLKNLEELKKSFLQKAFSGELTKEIIVSADKVYETTSPEFAANVIAFAYFQHAKNNKENTFGHVKAQKLLHLTESIVGIDLGRSPQKDAAGPNDFQHMLEAEKWAKTHKYFKFTKRPKGYSFEKLQNFDDLIAEADSVLNPYEQKLTDLVSLLVPMKSRQAEVFATVHAAWNNMILDNKEITDEFIVYEARDNWHEDKLKISKEEFEKAIDNIRAKNLEPNGTAKRVIGQEKLL